jgi:hypothetical protein
VNLEIINGEKDEAKTFRCTGNAKVLLDQVTIRSQNGDQGIALEDSCSIVIANSIITQATDNNIDTIQIKETSKLDVIFSTFLDNFDNVEQAIIEVQNGSQCRFDSVVGFNNGGTPITGTVTGLNPTNNSFSFVDNATFSGNQDVNPRIATNFRLQATSPAINQGNTSLDVTKLIFNPVLEFGINPYAHDRAGAPRVKNGRADAGAFEDF